MAEITVHAVVLRRRDAGESDRRLTLLTQEIGVVDVVAKGARKAGSRLAGCSEPMMACIFGIATGTRQSFVTQAQPVSAFPGLRSDYDRLTYGLALCELAAAVAPHGERVEDLFRFVATALSYLEVHETPLACLLWAEGRLMEMSGFRPDFSRCAVSGTPMDEAYPSVSPIAGGFVSAPVAGRFADRFSTTAEVLFGAEKLLARAEPPSRFRFAGETFALLHRFWEHFAESHLPAGRQVLAKLRDDGSGDV